MLTNKMNDQLRADEWFNPGHQNVKMTCCGKMVRVARNSYFSWCPCCGQRLF